MTVKQCIDYLWILPDNDILAILSEYYQTLFSNHPSAYKTIKFDDKDYRHIAICKYETPNGWIDEAIRLGYRNDVDDYWYVNADVDADMDIDDITGLIAILRRYKLNRL
jgi:hypothetical protein